MFTISQQIVLRLYSSLKLQNRFLTHLGPRLWQTILHEVQLEGGEEEHEEVADQHERDRAEKKHQWVVVVAQLVERSLKIPAVRGRMQSSAKFFIYINIEPLFSVNCVLKRRK